jgi:adenine-specific DNA-methyltransferase
MSKDRDPPAPLVERSASARGRTVYAGRDEERERLVREDQLMLAGLLELPASADPDPNATYGEIFTRRWVVDFILDLVEYTPDRDLGALTLVEPSCGTGAFLEAVVERLIASARLHERDLRELGSSVRAFDLLKSNAYVARRIVVGQLEKHGLESRDAKALAEEWVRAGDYLLHDHGPPAADFVVGNPPYIRLEHIHPRTMKAYREVCPTMRGRADVYVGFIEKGLRTLKPDGRLAFICADRWMRNQYGADLRELITSRFALEAIVSMHEVDAFEKEVSAYPAVVVLRRRSQGTAALVEARAQFAATDASRVSAWARHGSKRSLKHRAFEATRVEGWFSGRDLWPTGTPAQLSTIAALEAKFPPLQDPATGTRVGIGIATGCDEIFITSDPGLVETERLLPLLQAPDIASGGTEWAGRYLVNPWNGSGLVDLESYPRLAAYLRGNDERLRARHVARLRPAQWYRTIDRVDPALTALPKLVIPDMKAAAHPVLDEGRFYPHHNLYFVVSEQWDLEVLGGLLLSDIANLFVGAYCVRMRGGTYRFQAQYLRRIRVPPLQNLSKDERRDLARAFVARDRDRATFIAERLYRLRR